MSAQTPAPTLASLKALVADVYSATPLAIFAGAVREILQSRTATAAQHASAQPATAR